MNTNTTTTHIHIRRSLGTLAIGLLVLGVFSGCRDLQKRRVELKQASGADSTLDPRFGLTPDAQDPSQRDKELGYGKWKLKPELDGTDSPTSPDRRKSFGSP